MLPRLTLPPKPGTLALIALAFALPGLAGHDLWKTHDAIGLGIVHDMATSGTPLVPRVAGDPWLFDPPLYHWLALAFGAVFQLVVEFHSGARLASGALVLAAFWLIYLAAAPCTRRSSLSCMRTKRFPSSLRSPRCAARSPRCRTPSGGRCAPARSSAPRSASPRSLPCGSRRSPS